MATEAGLVDLVRVLQVWSVRVIELLELNWVVERRELLLLFARGCRVLDGNWA